MAAGYEGDRSKQWVMGYSVKTGTMGLIETLSPKRCVEALSELGCVQFAQVQPHIYILLCKNRQQLPCKEALLVMWRRSCPTPFTICCTRVQYSLTARDLAEAHTTRTHREDIRAELGFIRVSQITFG